MINNNNGVKKNIFNIINNYNTKTIKNNSIKDNSFKINIKNKSKIENTFHIKNNSSSNFKYKNINSNLNSNNLKKIYKKEYFHKKRNTLNYLNEINTFIGYNSNKNKSCKYNKSLNLFKPICSNEEKNNSF